MLYYPVMLPIWESPTVPEFFFLKGTDPSAIPILANSYYLCMQHLCSSVDFSGIIFVKEWTIQGANSPSCESMALCAGIQMRPFHLCINF